MGSLAPSTVRIVPVAAFAASFWWYSGCQVEGAV
jgi:hypothetical protein